MYNFLFAKLVFHLPLITHHVPHTTAFHINFHLPDCEHYTLHKCCLYTGKFYYFVEVPINLPTCFIFIRTVTKYNIIRVIFRGQCDLFRPNKSQIECK